MILGFSDYKTQGQRLAKRLGQRFQTIDIHRFPDGESKVTLPADLPERVIFCRSLDRPNDKLIELMLAARTARDNGAKHLTLVAPYLCYMRQDIAFHPGEAVSQRIIGRFLAELFDAVITVDPHLHRIERLEQVIPNGAAISVSASKAMRAFLAKGAADPLLMGPDEEARQWVRALAEPAGLEYAVAHKKRIGDRDVRVILPKQDFVHRTVILVDDMISTGRTLMTVARALKEKGASSIHCLVTHPLFADDATRHLQEAGVDRVWSTDSIAHPTNAVALDQALAEAIERLG